MPHGPVGGTREFVAAPRLLGGAGVVDVAHDEHAGGTGHESKCVGSTGGEAMVALSRGLNGAHLSFLHTGMPLGEPSPFAEQGEKVAGGRMRGWATLALARHPSPQPCYELCQAKPVAWK